jgi:hypothetical protein
MSTRIGDLMTQAETYRMASESGVIGSFTGIRVFQSYLLERGQYIVGLDPAAVGMSSVVFEGLGLLRGVAHRAPGVERGYLVSQAGSSCDLLDAATGKIVRVRAEDAVEIEERYRSKKLADIAGGSNGTS